MDRLQLYKDCTAEHATVIYIEQVFVMYREPEDNINTLLEKTFTYPFFSLQLNASTTQ